MLGEKEKAPGRPYCNLSVPKRSYKKAGEGFFTKAWNEFKLKDERFIPDIRKKFFT